MTKSITSISLLDICIVSKPCRNTFVCRASKKELLTVSKNFCPPCCEPGNVRLIIPFLFLVIFNFNLETDKNFGETSPFISEKIFKEATRSGILATTLLLGSSIFIPFNFKPKSELLVSHVSDVSLSCALYPSSLFESTSSK